MINLLISSLLVIGVIAIIIYIQRKLSKSENKFLGLILPGISFLYSIFMVISLLIFTGTTTDSYSIIDEETQEIIEEREEVTKEDIETTDLLNIGYSFLLANTPTFILMGIYINQRTKINRSKEVERMKINDL